MTTTPVLATTDLVGGQAIPETKVNDNTRRLEQGAQQFAVLDKDLTAPPGGTPADGAAYIVAASPTGAWAGKAKNIAFWQTGTGWRFIAPREGMRADVADEDIGYRYDGSAWVVVAAGSLGGATLDTDGTLASNSDSKVPTQKAVKTYVDAAVVGLLDYKGGIDCSSNPNYPAALKGDSYVVTVAGKIGGASGAVVEAGDFFFAKADNAGGTQAGVGSSWDILQYNQVASSSVVNFKDLLDVPNSYSGFAGKVAAVKATEDGLEFIAASAVTASADASIDAQYFGDGSDGAVTISSGTTTLSRDMYYSNLTINGTGKLVANGWKIHVSGTLDISAAPAGALSGDGSNGGNGTTVAGGTAGGNSGTSNTLGTGLAGASGGAGSTTNGTGAGNSNTNTFVGAIGGTGGTGGASGTGNTGGVASAPSALTLAGDIRRLATELASWVSGTWTRINGGQGGGGGGGGAGDGVGGGSGGGGSGAGGRVLFIAARTINRGGSTAAGAISAKGGNGGNAGSLSGTGTNKGGGGGGAGGGGGWIYLIYRTLTGSTATNCLDATGGNGGAGTNGAGTGSGGNGGGAGGGGRIEVYDLTAGTQTIVGVTAPVAGNAASGATAGAALTATAQRRNL